MEDRLRGLSTSREPLPPPAAPPAARSRLWFAGAAAVVAMFAAFRVALLYAREPFFDELFTIWIARQEWLDLLRSLREDSGPPLYYYLVKLLFGPSLAGSTSAVLQVQSVRLLSLLAGVGAAVAILLARRFGAARLAAVMLLAVYPAHLYFSTEARAYALCALLTGVGTLALAGWAESGRRRELAGACAAMVLAAYSHYYAVLLFPLPLILGAALRDRRRLVAAIVATAAITFAYVPGFLLAAAQPPESIRWMQGTGGLDVAGSVVRQLGFAGPFHVGFLPTAPRWMQWLSAALVLAVLGAGIARSRRARIFVTMVAVPAVLAVAFTAAGRPVYFPLRFESVLAVPLVMAIALSMLELPRTLRALAFAVLAAVGAAVCISAVVEHGRWAGDSYRHAARFARRHIDDPNITIAASGPHYLELIAQRDSAWSPLVVAFPPSQALHPGWTAPADAATLSRDRQTLRRAQGGFVWVGTEGSPEMSSLTRGAPTVEVLFRHGPSVVLLVSTHGMEDEEKEHQPHAAEKEQADAGAGR